MSTIQRPNILVIMSDEHNAGVAGCYGNDIIQTPSLDRLSRQGITFENCYCNSPLCVPSRLSFTSGKYISRVGAWNNNCWLPSDDYPSLPRIMNAVGYESILCGKMHYDWTRNYGFRVIGTNLHNYTKTGRGGRRKVGDLSPKPGISERFNDFHVGESSRIIAHDRMVSRNAINFLKKRKATEEPFFLLVGYKAPHFPLIVPEKYWKQYEDQVPMPYIPKSHLESQPRNYRHLRIHSNIENVPNDIVKRGRELYYGLTQWLDEEIGKVLNSLENSEVAYNTVVIYTADHGENLGEHGLWWKNCMYEHACRIPLIISWPAHWNGGQRRIGACSLLDVVQTIAELGGTKVPSDWNGDSMIPWLNDVKHGWKDLAVSEYYAGKVVSGFAMIRKGQYKYVYHTPVNSNYPPEYELYNLKNDPHEFNNLSSQNTYKELLTQMHLALVNEIGEKPDMTERRCRKDYARGYDRKNI
ncbi:choline-sulfatase [candidate division KSB3 bacterium]|uniref:Choline-sulfatase n=1 Tax=candidate division KSB3 bacterium TaxID=2044937 RepID=A0A2G6E4S0_9BACT|nr:MAG: choline-sulfatase [candidate division KSB3 bacterium]PIE29496.1 MAG: choline-sulfatase [candidate division KSB3 bacterium]